VIVEWEALYPHVELPKPYHIGVRTLAWTDQEARAWCGATLDREPFPVEAEEAE
jgi:predicted DNA-binding transcriptional regulator AlpA